MNSQSTSDASQGESLDEGLSWLAGAGEPAALSVTIEVPPPGGAGVTRTPAPPSPAPEGESQGESASAGDDPTRPELGRYDVIETLGQGGMGVVYLAKEGNLRRSVALKCTHSSRVDADSLKRFVLEAQITAQLEHPGIVPVYALELANDGTVAYSMKRIEGRELADEIAALRELFAREGHSRAFRRQRRSLLDRFVRVCEAVHYAHDHGVTHRDLKPANIMLRESGPPVLVDFGIAVAKDRTRLTTDGMVPGTAAYMAPEVFELGSAACDVVTAQRSVRSAVTRVGVGVRFPPVTPRLAPRSERAHREPGAWGGSSGRAPRPLTGVVAVRLRTSPPGGDSGRRDGSKAHLVSASG